MRSEARPMPGSIVVVGNGQVALAAAIALRRTLPRTAVTIVPCPADPSAFADRAMTTLPQSNAFHDRLGLNDDGFIIGTGASHRLGVRFIGWRGDPASYTHAFGAFADGTESVSQTLADANAFDTPVDDVASPLSDVDYALRHHQPAYHRRLLGLAGHLGIEMSKASFVAAVPNATGDVGHVILADGTELRANLFIDCTGPQALLLNSLAPSAFESWVPYLPCDRMVLATAPAAPALCVTDNVEAFPFGWRFSIPGRDGTHKGAAYHHDVTKDSDVEKLLGQQPGEVITFTPGRAENSWVGNVIAFGDAAAVFEPLHWINLALAHTQISLFLELLPGDKVDPLERAEYNRRASAMADRVRDYIGLHYCIPHPPQGPFWQYATGLRRSDALSLTLSEFAKRGRWPFFEDDMLPSDAWRSAMACIGIAAGPNARALSTPPQLIAQHIQQQQMRSTAALAVATSYPLWLKNYLERKS
jgi:tryptophan 7-halogenase